ncbi:L,D-transpeptidase family protein [Nonomuraea ceibae]|uniref:L,D-transpeptidase family protein n=1 Tax=Nonomuraea ceibae TaxID=1935170 RepID=UPI001C5E4FDA|nr:L,D-transpeptidase family protein [Nonomuraea ceibae]
MINVLVLAVGLGLPLAPAVPAPAALAPAARAAADPAAPAGVLRPGDRGPAVKQMQRRLRAGGYFWGQADGVFDESTRAAVWGFQKSQGMRPRNVADAKVLRALERPRRMRPLVPGGPRDRVEIDLRRQLLAVYRDRRPVLVSHMSSGAGVQFCEGGRCRIARTPEGDFRVTKRAPGWTTGPLGSMYNSLYFVGGVAMHGSTKVPLRPASHGCVRVPMDTADKLYRLVDVGEPVYVRRGGR